MSLADVPLSRQQVIAGAGLGLAATVVAACSSSGEQPPASSDASTTAAPRPLAKTADVPVGSGLIVDGVVLTQPSAGVFKGFTAKCTHAGCTLNKVADGTIDCPCHGSKFHLDGTVAQGPATEPLKAKTVTVQGDSLILG